MAIKIPQVREQGLPTTTGVKTPNADAFGAGVGDALGGLGNQLGDIGLDLQNKENEAKARESDTYFTQKVANLQIAYEQQDGEVAYKSNPDYLQALDDIRREAEEMLDNDDQRNRVRVLFDNKQNAAAIAGKRHAAKAMEKWNLTAIEGQRDSNVQLAAATYGTPQGAAHMQAVMENIEDLGLEQGKHPDQIAADQQAKLSEITAGVINSRIQSDPEGAKLLFDEKVASGELSATDAQKIQPRVDAYFRDEMVRIGARAITQSGALPEEMIAMVNDITDPEQREKTLQRVREHIRFQDTMERLNKKKLVDMNLDQIRQAGPNATLDMVKPAEEIGAEANKALTGVVEKQQKTGRTIETDDVYEQGERLKFSQGKEEYRKNYKREDHVLKMSPDDLDKFEKDIFAKPDPMKISDETLRKNYLAGLGLAGKQEGKKAEKAARALTVLNQAMVDEARGNGDKPLSNAQRMKAAKEAAYRFATDNALPSIEIDGSGFFNDDEITPAELRERQASPVTAITATTGEPYAWEDVEFAIISLTREKKSPNISDSDIKEFLKDFETK